MVSAVSLLLASQAFVRVGHQGAAGVHDRYPDWQVVQALNGDGVRAGDRVSYIGDALADHVWAYLAHVTIAAEIPPDDMSTFWAATDSQRQDVAGWLRTQGVKAVVSRDVPPPAYSSGWKKVGDTSYAIWGLSEPTADLIGMRASKLRHNPGSARP